MNLYTKKIPLLVVRAYLVNAESQQVLCALAPEPVTLLIETLPSSARIPHSLFLPITAPRMRANLHVQ